MARFCNKCNYPIEEGGAFCTECGSNDIRDEMKPQKPKPAKAKTPTTSVPLVQMTTTPQANVGVQSQGNIIGVQAVSNTEGENNNLTIPSVTLPTVGTIQTTTPAETPKSSFADVPDFMSGEGISSNATTVTVPKDFHLQDGGSENTYGPNINPAILNKSVARKKKQKNHLLVMVLVVTALAITGFLLLFMYYYGKEIGGQGPEGPFTTNEVGTNADNQGFDYTTMFTNENSFRVGNASFGYISIPNTWSKFKDVEGNNTLQFTDNGTWIVTIYAMPTTSVTAKDWANNVYNAVVQNGGQDILASTSTIDSYSALTVTAYYPVQGKYLSTWFFESKSGKTHYLAIEGPEPQGDPYYCIYSFKEDH